MLLYTCRAAGAWVCEVLPFLQAPARDQMTE